MKYARQAHFHALCVATSTNVFEECIRCASVLLIEDPNLLSASKSKSHATQENTRVNENEEKKSSKSSSSSTSSRSSRSIKLQMLLQIAEEKKRMEMELIEQELSTKRE